MSSRTNLRPQPVIGVGTTVSGSMAANIISLPTVLQSLSCASYSFTWTGTSPVGSVSFQVSDDYSLLPNGQVNNPGTWNTAPLTVNGSNVTLVPVSGNTGTGFIDIPVTGSYACRVIYTFTSGTGTMAATFTGKVQ